MRFLLRHPRISFVRATNYLKNPFQQRPNLQFSHHVAHNALRQPEAVYVPEVDLEDFESYTTDSYHPIVIGDTFQKGRYKIVYKLGFGKRFIPHLLDTISIESPNGRHTCLVQEAAGCSIAESKEDSVNFMFQTKTARSIAAQLIMGVAYLHSLGLCHGDLHLRNMLFHDPHLGELSPAMLYEIYRLDQAPIRRVDGAPVEPQAPAYAVYLMHMKIAADKLIEPLITISDYGTSFVLAAERSPKLYTPPLFLPPEDFFQKPITLAADIWTLGVSLYEILGERPLFETFSSDQDDIFADIISTLGPPPARWWDKWENRKDT
ncbi:hypothetical protein XA68_16698 [Ophiocordyceps unilateralis]|uniref:Protein kinase domain-containing protein n=1 Tax=Ophiocordyceps unilateralis TaxID=268505 RepID=A0A2A9P675_OPHUN|nr:hypothetical protein XA68_16698 [Ophiocordyceps unilateralis]